ncbi:MAG TPA: hypothetical protein VJN21_13460 [Candidatus Acidoferrales bacterium]|nr:hypothetical protein [Candidatus Acidoferrales bacterium]
MRNTRLLEAEIARLREENRALVNSILGLAGIPPMRIAASVGAGLAPPGRPNRRQEHDVVPREEMNSPVVPHRRRSWQQFGRAREIEDARAARRERETDAETFPAPRNIVPRI